MDRVCEPELMDDVAQAEAYAAADFSTSDDAFVQRLRDLFGRPGGPVVDLGCGPGNIALRVADAWPGCDVVGVDGAAAMIALARSRAGARRVRFLTARLPTELLPDAAFAAVVSNSLLHHLPDPGVLWAAIRRAGAPGAAVLVGDLRRPATPEAARALVDAYAADDPEVLRRDFLASLCAAFTPGEVRAQLDAAGLDWTVQAVGDRHLAVWGRVPGGPLEAPRAG